MKNEHQNEGLGAQDFTQQRNETLKEGVRGLFIINGGGTLALLAFLQAVWKDQTVLARYLVGGITCLVLGVVFAALVQFFRYPASFNFQGGRLIVFRLFRSLYLGCSYTSLLCFIVGIGVVLAGVWCSIRCAATA
jgi:hypothetical protein